MVISVRLSIITVSPSDAQKLVFANSISHTKPHRLLNVYWSIKKPYRWDTTSWRAHHLSAWMDIPVEIVKNGIRRHILGIPFSTNKIIFVISVTIRQKKICWALIHSRQRFIKFSITWHKKSIHLCEVATSWPIILHILELFQKQLVVISLSRLYKTKNIKLLTLASFKSVSGSSELFPPFLPPSILSYFRSKKTFHELWSVRRFVMATWFWWAARAIHARWIITKIITASLMANCLHRRDLNLQRIMPLSRLRIHLKNR